MDKYEKRRLRLIQLRDDYCNGNGSELARRIDREPSYVSRMLWPEDKKGRKRIADNMIEIIESAFSLPRGWMDGIVDEKSNITFVPQPINTRRYPVVSWVSAGAWAEALEPYTLQDIEEWCETDAHVEGDGFWLKIKGDSMTSPVGLSIPEGLLVLFDTGREAKHGSLVLAKATDANEATFKKLVIDGGEKYLKPLNPLYPLIPINGNCRIIGVAIESRQKFI
ncbi:hypothetical protein CIG19_18845 [Enterobacterales bacterium CwR94]|nr:hypothetical protein CIG19_18845 [Enterobacterales bacterium CwR94]